jgi:hypothetical protein
MAGLSVAARAPARVRACASRAQARGGGHHGLRRGGAGQAVEQQLALLDGIAHGRIDRHFADELELDGHFQAGADEAVDHLLQLAADDAALAGLADLVDQHADVAPVLRGGQHLDGGVGVGQRGRLGRGHDQHLVGQRHRVENDVRDPGARIEQDAVEARHHLAHDFDELLAHLGRQARVFDHPRAGQQDREAARCLEDGLVQGALAGEDVVQRDLGKQVQHDVEVGQAQVGVEHQHLLALARERRGQVGRQEGLADAALAARDGGDARPVSGRSRRRIHDRSPKMDDANSRPFSSAETTETGVGSRQVRLRPSDLAR